VIIPGYTPHTKQRDFHESDAMFRVLVGSERSGKTCAGAHEDIKMMFRARARGAGKHAGRGWIIAPTLKLCETAAGKIVKIAEAIQKEAAKKGLRFPIKTRAWNTSPTIEFFDGKFIIECKSAIEPDRIAAETVDFVHLDEYGLMPQIIFEKCRTRLLDYDGRLIVTSTPNGKNHLYQLYLAGQDPSRPNYESWKIYVKDNPIMTDEKIDRLTADMDKSEYNRRIMAEFSDPELTVFYGFDDCMTHPMLLNPLDSGQYVMGLDLAERRDYTAYCIMDRRDFRVVHMERLADRTFFPWRRIKRHIYKAAKFWRCEVIIADATGVGAPVCQDLESWGLNVTPFIFSATSKKQLVADAVVAFNEGVIILPLRGSCEIAEILHTELSQYEARYTPAGNVSYGHRAGNSFHDDMVDCLMLALHGCITGAGQIISHEEFDFDCRDPGEYREEEEYEKLAS